MEKPRKPPSRPVHWSGRLTGTASEWSPWFPVYVAGAIEAANLGLQSILEEQ